MNVSPERKTIMKQHTTLHAHMSESPLIFQWIYWNTQWKHLQSRKKIIPKESPLRFPVGNQTLTEMSFALLVFSVFLSSLWKRQNDSQWQLISFWEIHWHPFQQARSHRRSQDRAVPAGEIPSLSTGKSEADQLKVKLLSIFSVTNCVILFIVLN